MAAVDTSSHQQTSHEQQAPPVPSDSEGAMALDSSINGAAMQHNSIPAFSSPQPSSDYLQLESQSEPPAAPPAKDPANMQDVSEPPSHVEAGITPTAPFTNEGPSTLDPSITAASTTSPSTLNDHSTVENQADIPSKPTEPVAETPSNTLNATSSLPNGTGEPATEPSTNPEAGSVQHESTEIRSAPSSERTMGAIPSAGQEPKPSAEPAEPADQEMSDAPPAAKVAREREDDEVEQPSAKRPKTEFDGTQESDAQTTSVLPTTESSQPAIATDAQPQVPLNQPAANGATHPTATSEPASFDEWGPLRDVQAKQLRQNMQNFKKGRHAAAFAKPVDPVALNLPTYPEIIKNPMDLGTMDGKIKEDKYASVADFINDFNLIIDNCITFNGPQHVISQQAQALRAQFTAAMRKVPKAGEAAPPPEIKKRRSSLGPLPPERESKARESKPSFAVPPTPNGTQAFALDQNGNPLIRRTSTGMDGRPKREIHRPTGRDLPYLSSKPKKKKYQAELKFCEHVLSELKRPRYSQFMSPFAAPVDPVALNIPNYHKLIKKPMDFGTITEKLHNGQYENAKEFEADAKLVFENCYKFNGPQHPVSGLAKQLENQFNAELSHKTSWIQHNVAGSATVSPEAESESEVEDDDEEDEGPARAEEIAQIHKQIMELSQKAAALSSGVGVKKSKDSKKASGKGGKSSGSKDKRKSIGGAAKPKEKAPKPKAPPKPPRALTTKEKEEISERIGELSGDETARAAELIKAGLRKSGRPDLAERPDEELEFDIDAIPNDVLHSLLKLVRRNDGTTEISQGNMSRGSAAPSKHKKHKPMSKLEQEASLARLQGQLSNFDPAGGYAGASSPGSNAIDDDDDDDSGSESEEE